MWWRKWLLAAALIGHFYALYKPGGLGPGLLSLLPEGTDKIIHIGLFAVPAFLLRRITSRWWPVLVLALHAPASELLQWRFVPHRSGDVLDLVADLIGVGLGMGAAAWLRRRQETAERTESVGTMSP